jgi:uncharacterized protein YgbK (DUF1537 family)
MPILLGCIADDFTGATDLANTLVKNGMRTVQIIGVPKSGQLTDEIDAIVVALKSRTSSVEDAVRESLESLAWLRVQGARQIFFKYCSTFDSTPQGNIGPVAEALMKALETDFTIVCPAFPDNGRTVYQGHLFVHADLLSESSMRHHPLTPMTDANLLRVLRAQATSQIGLVDVQTVRRGSVAVLARFAELREQGLGFAITDAISNEDLLSLGEASAGLPLVTGGSALAMGLPKNFRRAGLLAEHAADNDLTPVRGRRAVISGSCSKTTFGQIEAARQRFPAFRLEPDAIASGNAIDEALAWVKLRLDDEPILIYSTADPDEVKATQARLGTLESGTLIEAALAQIARALVDKFEVRQLIVAGGETSGAVVNALGVERLRIGPEICPGVPWTNCVAPNGDTLALALKSGNFGAADMFITAWDWLS